MEGNESHVAALVETTVFLQSFKDMPDRRQQGKVNYPLAEILLLCLLAVLAGAETFTEIARFGEKKLAPLRRFRPYENGTPSHDHLGDIFATLDAKAFQRCFVAWVAAPRSSPSMAKPRVAPIKRRVRKNRSTWCRPSPRANDWCSDRSR